MPLLFVDALPIKTFGVIKDINTWLSLINSCSSEPDTDIEGISIDDIDVNATESACESSACKI